MLCIVRNGDCGEIKSINHGSVRSYLFGTPTRRYERASLRLFIGSLRLSNRAILLFTVVSVRVDRCCHALRAAKIQIIRALVSVVHLYA